MFLIGEMFSLNQESIDRDQTFLIEKLEKIKEGSVAQDNIYSAYEHRNYVHKLVGSFGEDWEQSLIVRRRDYTRECFFVKKTYSYQVFKHLRLI